LAFGTLAVASTQQSSTIYHYPTEAQETLNPLTSLTATPSPERVKEAVNWIEINMGLGKEFYNTLSCESGFSYFAFHANKEGGSFGVAQFIPTTFAGSCKGSYHSTQDQILCAAQMFKKNQQPQWDCWCLSHAGNAICQKRGFK
jgi:hypothetical protein